MRMMCSLGMEYIVCVSIVQIKYIPTSGSFSSRAVRSFTLDRVSLPLVMVNRRDKSKADILDEYVIAGAIGALSRRCKLRLTVFGSKAEDPGCQ